MIQEVSTFKINNNEIPILKIYSVTITTRNINCRNYIPFNYYRFKV